MEATRQRLIAAASELFAARGFHATKVRDIARRARVNLAAGNYHYGSKKELYLEVLRAQFAEIWGRLRRRGGSKPPAELARLRRDQVLELLGKRLRVMLDDLIGPPPGLHAALMQREMVDPSEALPVIVQEFIQPMFEEMEQIVERLAPGLSKEERRRCVLSIIGQAVFYRFAMPAMLRLHSFRSYPCGFAGELADFIATFSVGGMERVAERPLSRRSRGR